MVRQYWSDIVSGFFSPATGCEFHCNDKCFTTWQEFCTSECAPGNCGKLGLLILLLSIGCPLIHEYNANSLLCTTAASLFSRYFNYLSSLRAHTLAWSDIFSLCCAVCLVHAHTYALHTCILGDSGGIVNSLTHLYLWI